MCVCVCVCVLILRHRVMQAVYFNEKVYIFGGEYATLEQFHHYRDLWCLDLKTWEWEEIRCIGILHSS